MIFRDRKGREVGDLSFPLFLSLSFSWAEGGEEEETGSVKIRRRDRETIWRKWERDPFEREEKREGSAALDRGGGGGSDEVQEDEEEENARARKGESGGVLDLGQRSQIIFSLRRRFVLDLSGGGSRARAKRVRQGASPPPLPLSNYSLTPSAIYLRAARS